LVTYLKGFHMNILKKPAYTPKEKAATFFECSLSKIDSFCETDPFNPRNTVAGYICRIPDYRYGMLLITEVNGKMVFPQKIYGTPKIHYPFTKETRNYNFPKDIKEVLIYPKYDGTNVLRYIYRDQEGMPYRTFKTRLMPFLNDGKFGNFFQLWNELLKDNELWNLTSTFSSQTLSFEMYGYRNPHLVRYPFGLKTTLLFEIENGEVIPPIKNKSPYANQPVARITDKETLIDFYEKLRKETEENNKPTGNTEDQIIDGIEGYIFYVHTADSWIQFKCKPETIEQIHFANSGYLAKETILHAAWRVVESFGDVSIDGIKQMLEEDYSAELINNASVKIEKVYAFVSKKLFTRSKVEYIYDSAPVKLKVAGKNEVMKYLSFYFQKNEMPGAFQALQELGIVK